MLRSSMTRSKLCLLALGVVCLMYIYNKHASYCEYANRLTVNFADFSDHVASSGKPHLVFGIHSAEGNRDLRDAQRNTWISNTFLKTDQIPFRFTYKFLIDLPTPKTLEENAVNHDIVFLNVTHDRNAVKFGEKLYVWMKYIHNNYPDVLLAAKLDDDVFLCVPDMFHKLNSLKSSKLYYGWAHGSGPVIKKSRHVDGMFVVFGKEIIGRVAERQYCNDKHTCDLKKQLVETGSEGESLATWLSIYDDIDFRPDNGNLIHYSARYTEDKSYFIRKDFCEHRILYHKSSPDQMRQLHLYSTQTRRETNIIGSTSGSLFSGNVIRDLLPHEFIPEQNLSPQANRRFTCKHWAVVTTIFNPSEAVRRINTMSEWCLVIIADEKTPKKDVYMKDLENRNTIYLSLYDQDQLYPYLSKLIPRNSFGRKNIGYLFAFQHKANMIWDFDDDNIDVIDLNFVKQQSNYVTACADFKAKTLNPYPYFDDTIRPLWPRGLPLENLKDERTVPAICNNSLANEHVAVVQSLANVQPDVDALFRLTHYMPFNFTAIPSTHKILVVPKNVYSPFNAQATLWMQPAFDLMALPISVNGRVSDIWRSYIAEFLMYDRGLQMAFSPPFVTQQRNEHSNMKDFNAELDLYQKSEQLVDFLSFKHSKRIKTLSELYEELYRRDYLGASDVLFVHAWMSTFDQIKRHHSN